MENDEDTLFGLCDLGFGEPELGYVSLNEIVQANKKIAFPVERDVYWTPTKSISAYATAARQAGKIVEPE